VASLIQVTGAGEGLVQVFSPPNGSPSKVLAAVWIYVVRGHVGMGVGNGEDTTANVKSTKFGRSEHLIGFNSVMPTNWSSAAR
jgi:hypothetical protein